MQLPFAFDAPVRCYLHHAYATGIFAAATRRGETCLDYANLELRRGDAYSGEPDFLDFNPYTDLGTLALRGRVSLHDHPAVASLRTFNGPTFCRHVAACVRAGAYVCVHLDAFYAPWSAAHAQAHRSTKHLVIGHEGGIFIGANYRADGSFGSCCMPGEQLWPSVARQPELQAPFTADQLIREVRILSGETPPPARTLLEQRLGSFAASRPADGAPAEPGYTYGIGCYLAIAEEVAAAVQYGCAVDLRKTRLLAERAAVLAAGLEHCLDLAHRHPALLGDWKQAAALLQAFHVSCCQHNLRRVRPAGVADLLHRAAALETAVIARILG